MTTTWDKFQEELKAESLCGACGQYYEESEQGEDGCHSEKLCDANDDIKWANLPTTCADFVAHPHLVETEITWKNKDGSTTKETKLSGCYTCQMALASEEQGTTSLASALLDLDIACDVVQTGGFTMCVYIKTGEESYVYANDEGFSFYRDENCDGWANVVFAKSETTAKQKAKAIQTTMKTANLEAKEL